MDGISNFIGSQLVSFWKLEFWEIMRIFRMKWLLMEESD